MEHVTAQPGGVGVSIVGLLRAMLYNSLGRYGDALEVSRRAFEQQQPIDFMQFTLPELIEAAARAGEPEQALDALEQLSEMARHSGSDWALGIEARSRALLSDGEDAERLYREAIDRLSAPGTRVELARARLIYGEWLRRERRRIDAREQLRIAHDLFTTMGAEAFAERAARELRETARKRTVEANDQLTPQESQIARLAGEGLSNPEIGARLFISPRTVQYHLSKVFTKLNIRSRIELDTARYSEPAR